MLNQGHEQPYRRRTGMALGIAISNVTQKT